MSSIRPLFTITVLALVGGYLYVQINAGPTKRPGAQSAGNQIGDGVPPLATNSNASLAEDTAAPAWSPSTPPPAAPVASSDAANSSATPAGGGSPLPSVGATASSDGDSANDVLPAIPPIPELPELPSTTAAAPPAAAVATNSQSAAADGRYGGPTNPAASRIDAPQLSIPGDAAPPDGASGVPMPPAAPATNPNAAPGDNSNTLPIDAPSTIPAAPPIAQQTSPAAFPSADSPAPPASTDRYGLPVASPSTPAVSPFGAAPAAPSSTLPNAVPAAQSQSATPAGASFAASWPAIQAALDTGDLKQAHQLLSKWHGNETLTPAETERVEDLLGQLAGTVIYSTEHQLEPARIVKPGETLESIAREYNVPWQLLGKINNVQAPDQVRPGQQLKVVRGPFTATVDLHRSELTLEVDGRYAGTFPVTIPPGATVAEGQWLVEQKTGATPGGVSAASYPSAPAAAELAIVLRSAASAAGSPTAPTITITSAAAPATPGTAATALRVSPQDASDLSDILSIGSRVVVRR